MDMWPLLGGLRLQLKICSVISFCQTSWNSWNSGVYKCTIRNLWGCTYSSSSIFFFSFDEALQFSMPKNKWGGPVNLSFKKYLFYTCDYSSGRVRFVWPLLIQSPIRIYHIYKAVKQPSSLSGQRHPDSLIKSHLIWCQHMKHCHTYYLISCLATVPLVFTGDKQETGFETL